MSEEKVARQRMIGGEAKEQGRIECNGKVKRISGEMVEKKCDECKEKAD